ncbi:hypothetical protein B0H65DRAFT_198653 [Neurospora tetraspora]|uniref:Uncharacterized protein n=1 Tax=Neurospora tetraspora TaxID=94610 RepID=A0AAE0MS17_9PEZI|nr:hypothetical protein B0H65DRAFT_198653 [Neurospora tetraspora]
MSLTKWFKGSGSGRNDQDSVTLKNSKKKTKKRSEQEDYYTQDDMEGYVYDNNYHYQPAPGLQPQGYGYSQRMAAKPRKPRLAAQEGHFDAEELTRRLLDVLAEQKAHEAKKQRMREARTDPATQWQQRQEAAISSLNRAPTAAGRTTGLRKPSKSYADHDIEAAEEQEYRHVPNDAARALNQTDADKAIRQQDKLDKRAQGEHHRRSSEMTVEVPIAERTTALPHQTQPQLVLLDNNRAKQEQILDEASQGGHKARGQTDIDRAKRRHSLSLEGALSRISAAWASGASGGEQDHTTAVSASAPAPTSATAGTQPGASSKEPESIIFLHPLAIHTTTTTQDQATSQQEHQPAALPAAENNNRPAERALSNAKENDDLLALPSPTTQSQSQSLSQRLRGSTSLLNLRKKLGMNGSSGSGSGSGSGSSGSPGSPVTANSSGSSGSGLFTATTGISGGEEAATSPLTTASSCGAGGPGADNLPQPQLRQGLLKKTATGKSQEKEKERGKMNSKKSGFFAKLGGSVKKGMF